MTECEQSVDTVSGQCRHTETYTVTETSTSTPTKTFTPTMTGEGRVRGEPISLFVSLSHKTDLLNSVLVAILHGLVRRRASAIEPELAAIGVSTEASR